MEAPVAGWKTPAALRQPLNARAGRLTAGRRKSLVDRCAVILREGEPTCFAFEADCRHSLRAGLCLNGWSWARADYEAAEIVAEALRRIGARRPTWREGQPRFTEDGVSLIERSRCVWCGRQLPRGHKLWCSQTCGQRAGHHRRKRDSDAYNDAVRHAGRWWRTGDA